MSALSDTERAWILLGFIDFHEARNKRCLRHSIAGKMQACTSPRGIAKAREMQGTYAQSRPTSHWVNYMEGFIDATAGDREMRLCHQENR
ncbi:MAG TPA: hypothetical protein VEC08_01415 [Nitrososphaerales archaeon]|nr:hypothetical protein [Nitrososphaerales archaeon]